MSLSSGESIRFVLDYQAGKIGFEELFQSLELLIHDCFWKMLHRENIIKMRIMEEEDLRSLCWMAFYQSARDFKVEKGCTFSTYFYQNVQFAIRQEYKRLYRKKRKHNGMVSLEELTDKGVKLMEEVMYDPFTKIEEQEFLELVKAEMQALNFEPEVRTSILIHLTTGEPLMRVGKRYCISQSIASRRFIKLKKALQERLSAEWCA